MLIGRRGLSGLGLATGTSAGLLRALEHRALIEAGGGGFWHAAYNLTLLASLGARACAACDGPFFRALTLFSAELSFTGDKKRPGPNADENARKRK